MSTLNAIAEFLFHDVIIELQGKLADLEKRLVEKDAQIIRLRDQLHTTTDQREEALEVAADLRQAFFSLRNTFDGLESQFYDSTPAPCEVGQYVRVVKPFYSDLATHYEILSLRNQFRQVMAIESGMAQILVAGDKYVWAPLDCLELDDVPF